MRIFHLSDLHIGLKLMNYDLTEALEDAFGQVITYGKEYQPDAVVIAGDIYDKAIPSAEAVEIFNRFLSSLTEALPDTKIMMISGNHDSARRVDLYRNILARENIHMIGMPPVEKGEGIEVVTMEDALGPVHFYLLPFVKPSVVRRLVAEEDEASLSYDETLHRLIGQQELQKDERNVLVSHQFYLPTGEQAESVSRSDSEVVQAGNIDAVQGDVLSAFDYAALGHIHKPMTVGDRKYRYCGTLIQCSLSEEGQDKGIIMVDLGEKGDVETTVLPIHQLRQVRRVEGRLQDVLQSPSEDYVSVQLTDENDLDVFDMRDRLRQAFPHLLNVTRSMQRGAVYETQPELEEELDILALCKQFLADLTPEEDDELQDVINTVTEVAR